MTAARMSLDDCMRTAAEAHERIRSLPPAAPRRAREIGNPWKGTEFSRLTLDWAATRVPADEEIRSQLSRLRARARELARNNAYVRQYLNLVRMNVVGPQGVKLQAQVRNADGMLNKPFNDKIEAAWAEFARDPTVDGRQDLVEFAQSQMECFAKEGEGLVRMRFGYPNKWGFALEALDPDRLDNDYWRYPGSDGREVRMGVEINNYTRPVAYHIWDAPMGLVGMIAEIHREPVPASEVIHLYRSDRIGQTRGVPSLAPVMYDLKMLGGYEEAELVSARVSASAMMVLTRKEGDSAGAYDDGGKTSEIELNPGTAVFAPDGYDMQAWDPQRPNANYPAFVKALLRKMSAGLGTSYNILANDLEGVNYSSMRSGMLSERDMWRALQQWFISRFYQRVYAEWLGMALLTGALVLDTRSRSRFLDVRWVPRGWAWVDPLKDAQAGTLEIQTGLSSRSELLAEQGKDFEDVIDQLREEQEIAAAAGVNITGPPSGQATAPAANDEEPSPGAQDAAGGRSVPAPNGNGKHGGRLGAYA